jgi:hypothetical protein
MLVREALLHICLSYRSTRIQLEGNDNQFCQWIYISHILRNFFVHYNGETKQERNQNFILFADCGFMEVSMMYIYVRQTATDTVLRTLLTDVFDKQVQRSCLN